MGNLLVINAGSSSLKFAIYGDGPQPLTEGAITEIGGQPRLTMNGRSTTVTAPNHQAALDVVLESLQQTPFKPAALQSAAHRIVHGGHTLTQTCRITPEIELEIEACVPLAPLHNPHNLAAIRALRNFAPHLTQYASFDTAFHATNPDVAVHYALPADIRNLGIRRYGFHGISYAGLVETLPVVSSALLPHRLLAFHLGNGASLCAIVDGKSVATTMGYSPLDGLTMGTRSGTIDGNAVLRLAEIYGIPKTGDILNKQSGLFALGGASDMRSLHQQNSPHARFALEHFCYWAVRHAGSMIAAMGGLDAVAFTGGIGENDSRCRAEIMQRLAWLGLDVDLAANQNNSSRLHKASSPIAAWIVPAAEDRTIAGEVKKLMATET